MTHRWLALRLGAPLMAFGGVAIDQAGPTRDFPAASMLAGLIGNALGWHWSDGDRHQALQDRLIFGSRRDREGTVLTDVQNARLARSDKGWTTHGKPEGREGASYAAPHRRMRDYLADAMTRIVLRLDPAGQPPTLEQVAGAFDRPARPLYIGRKACLPAIPMAPVREDERWVVASTAHAALCALPASGNRLRAQWPVGQGPEASDGAGPFIVSDLPDLRNWRTGLHVGSRRVVEGRVSPASP